MPLVAFNFKTYKFFPTFMNKRKILCVATVNQLTQKILINLLFFPSAYCAAQ